MRYLLSLLLIFSFAFAQKTIVVKKHVDDEKKIEVNVKVEDEKVLYSITEDGKTEEYKADLGDEEALAKIQEKLEARGIDEDIKIHTKILGHDCNKEDCEHSECDKVKKVKIIKKIKGHDCAKEGCDPAGCKHAQKADCDDGVFVWHMKDGDDEKKIKFMKQHEMLDEKAGFLGVQIQDLSGQLSEYFNVKDGFGALVSEVVKDSPAEKAGLKAGDVITKVEDKKVGNAAELTKTVRSFEPKSKVAVTVVRNGKVKKLNVTLGEAENKFVYKFGNLDKLHDQHEMQLKMPHHELKDFEFHDFSFDQKKFKKEMDELKKELDKLKIELKQLKSNK